jgi:hypothetical protein
MPFAMSAVSRVQTSVMTPVRTLWEDPPIGAKVSMPTDTLRIGRLQMLGHQIDNARVIV